MTHYLKCTFGLVLLWGSLTIVSQADEQYVVRSGDSLSKIAQKFYGDPMKWTLIYSKNKNLIQDRDQLKIGWRLIIPSQAAKPSRVTEAKNGSTSLKSTVVRLVTGDSYPPFTDRKLYRDGMITDIVIRIMTKMGYKRQNIEIEWWSWKHGFRLQRKASFLRLFLI